MGLESEKTRWLGLETWPFSPSLGVDPIAGENDVMSDVKLTLSGWPS